MTKSRMKFGVLLAVMLIMSMAFVSAASAQEQVPSINTKEIEIKEKAMQNLASDVDYAKNSEKATKIRKVIEKQMKADIEHVFQDKVKDVKTKTEDLQTGDVQILAYDSVYLGTDKTFSNADYGTYGESTWGLAPWFYGSDYYLSSKKAEASSVVGPGGYGGAGAWSMVGKQFYISGTGSQTANIRMAGHMNGLTSAAVGGSSSTEINLVLWDLTTGTEYRTPIYSKSHAALGWTPVDRDFNNGVAVNLESQHYYIALLEVITDAATYGIGGGGSDFGRFDGDSGEEVWYSDITVDF